MGDYGLNQTFEYMELNLDSWDSATSGGQTFNGSSANTSLIQYSWPQYFFTSKNPQVAGLKVLQAEIPFVYDVINSVNNRFVYTVGGTPNTIAIPPGTYTGPQLAATLQTLFQTITPGFLVEWKSQSLKFLFTNPLATPWSLYFANRDTPYSCLGFVPGKIVSTAGVNSQILSTTIAQVSGPYYLYINSRKMGPLINCNLPDESKTSGIGPQIARIPVNVQFGSVIFYTDPDPGKYFDFFAGSQFDTFDLFLTLGSDQNQVPLDLKGSPWSVKLGVLIYRPATTDLYQKPLLNRKNGTTIINA
jgi:hypothetical protein